MVYNFSSDEDADDRSTGTQTSVVTNGPSPRNESSKTRKSSGTKKSSQTNKSGDDASPADAPTKISPTNSEDVVEVGDIGSGDDSSVVVIATKKAKNFTMFEWWFLFRAYVRVSEDATQGADRKSDGFWIEVEKCFSHQVSKYVMQYPTEANHFDLRKPDQLRLQYSTRLQPQLNKWFKVVKKIPFVSGTDKEQLYARQLEVYKQDKTVMKRLGKVLLYSFTQKLASGRMVDIPAYAEDHPKWQTFTKDRLSNKQVGEEVTVIDNPKTKRPSGAKAEAAEKKARKGVKLEPENDDDSMGKKTFSSDPFIEMLTKTIKDTSVVVDKSVNGQQEREKNNFMLRQERQRHDFVFGIMDRFTKMNETDKAALWEPLTSTLRAVADSTMAPMHTVTFGSAVSSDNVASPGSAASSEDKDGSSNIEP